MVLGDGNDDGHAEEEVYDDDDDDAGGGGYDGDDAHLQNRKQW